MIKAFTLFLFFLLTGSLLFPRQVSAQAPDKMSYQAVIRDASGDLVTEHEIGMQISILQGTVDGAVVYSEVQTPTTNANGLVSIEIGTGTVESGDFSAIDWASGPYFIKTETAVEAPLTTYTITGTSQLLSVPYALHAKTAETISEPIVESDPVFEASPSAGIEAVNIANWDEAHSWGDHTDAGYLAEYTETDPKFTETFNIDNPQDGDLLKYDAETGKWAESTPDYAQANHIHDDATIESAGFMSMADKIKLDALQNADGSETVILSDNNIIITGSGTTEDPYIISVHPDYHVGLHPPSVTINEASNITRNSAILNAIVNAEGFSTNVVFEWGETVEYGNTLSAVQSPVTGSADTEVSAVLEGLDAETIYNYRIRATNAVDISYSEPEIFQTEEWSCTIADLHSMGNGDVDCLLEDVYVTYVSPDGLYLQKVHEGPAIFSLEGLGWVPDVNSGDMIDIHVHELGTFRDNRQITVRTLTAIKGTNFDIDFLIKDVTEDFVLSHENQSEIVKITGAVVNQIDGTTVIATYGSSGDWVEIRLDDVSGLDLDYTFDIVGLVHANNGTHYLRSWADDHLSNISPPDIQSYTVTYHGNGNTDGTAPIDANEYEQGQQVTVLDNTGGLEKSGHAFSGWNTESDGTGIYYAPGEAFSMGTENITLYAIYNMVLNGDMENWVGDDTLPGWTASALGENTNVNRVDGYTGSWAVQLEDVSTSDHLELTQVVYGIDQLPPELAGETVTITLWSRKVSGAADVFGTVCVIDGPSSTCSSLPTGNGWVRTIFTHQVAGNANSLSVVLSPTGEDPAEASTYDFDNVILMPGIYD